MSHENPMNVTFIQTSDSVFYHDMLQSTARTVRTYALRHGYKYESYMGIKRGMLPWQASYNRIYMLKEMLDRNVTGWVFYLDSDAYIDNLDFDLKDYLADKDGYAGIFSGFINNVPHWVNSGGFAINFSHAVGRRLVQDYWSVVAGIPDEKWNSAKIWEQDLEDYQHMLNSLLNRYVVDEGLGYNFLFEREGTCPVNLGPFIWQHIRAHAPGFPARVANLTKRVEEVTAGQTVEWPSMGPGLYFPATHPAVETQVGRKTACGLTTTHRNGVLAFGPYVRLSAGHHTVRLFGRLLDAGHPQVQVAITAESGGHLIQESEIILANTSDMILAEIPFEIESDHDNVEVVIQVHDQHDIDLHAVQFFKHRFDGPNRGIQKGREELPNLNWDEAEQQTN